MRSSLFCAYFRAFPVKFAITTYPRKGTETFFNHTILLINQITTYPPQGDGNTFPLTFATVVVYYNLSPQGDGNLMRMSFPYFLPSITIYPRKGTET